MASFQFTKLPRQNDKTRDYQQPIELTETSYVNDQGLILVQKKDHNKDHPLSYRSDIDGLRAIAILGVVIYHVLPNWLSGGFVGVDIFFVISGYLISSIIVKKCQKGQFSFIDFYIRRIKRIYPALLVVLIFILLVCCYQILPRFMMVITKTMAASTIFCANIQSMLYHSTYFDPYQHVNAVLHLWSLGVEEQFYIVWPFILYLTITKLSSGRAFILLSMFTVSCFAYSLYIINIDQKIAFYFPLGRFWQLSIGGLIAFKNLKIKNQKISNALSIIGLFLVGRAMITITGNDIFPGWLAVLPTIGAVCIIQAGQGSLFNKHVLSNAVFVYIGKISYPLYLWHWPLLTFSKLLFPRVGDSIFQSTLSIIILSFILSIATYHFVENKIRYRKSKITVLILILLMCLVGMVSYDMYHYPRNYSMAYKKMKSQQPSFVYKPGPDDFYLKDGKMRPNSSKNKKRQQITPQTVRYSMADEFPDQNAHSYIEVKNESRYFDPNVPNDFIRLVINQKGTKQVFVVGDSHSQKIKHRFSYLWQQSKLLNKSEQFPVINIISRGGPFLPSSPIFNFTLEQLKKHKPQRLLIVNRWFMYLDKKYNPQYSDEADSKRLKAVVKDLVDAINTVKQISPMTEIYIVNLKIQGEIVNPSNMINLYGVIQKMVKPLKYSEFRQQKKQIYEVFEAGIKSTGINLIDSAQHECWEDICYFTIPWGMPLLCDTDHYTQFYSANWNSAADHVLEF